MYELMKRDGFENQNLFSLSEGLTSKMESSPLTSPLLITDIGHFPQARDHYVQRSDGIPQSVLIYCVGGEGWVEVGKGSKAVRSWVKTDTYVVLPPNEAHAYGSLEGGSWAIYWVHFRGDAAAHLAQALAPDGFGNPVSMPRRNDTINVFDGILQGLDGGVFYNQCAYGSMRMWHFFGDLIFRRRQASIEATDASNQVIALMNEKLEQSLTLDDMCNHVNLTPAYFCSLFREKTGLSPVDYFTRLKIQRACKFLDFSDMKVKEVGRRMGFEDPYYFSRCFKKVMNISPKEYRNRPKG